MAGNEGPMVKSRWRPNLAGEARLVVSDRDDQPFSIFVLSLGDDPLPQTPRSPLCQLKSTLHAPLPPLAAIQITDLHALLARPESQHGNLGAAEPGRADGDQVRVQVGREDVAAWPPPSVREGSGEGVLARGRAGRSREHGSVPNAVRWI
jgi:hypothetical protein